MTPARTSRPSAGTVALRPVTAADAADLFRWRSDPRSSRHFRTDLGSYENHLAFVARHLASGNRDEWFIIEAGHEPVGTIALYNFSDDGRSAEFGRLLIDPEKRRHGHGEQALRLLVERARALHLRELTCEVLADNGNALRLYNAAGFIERDSRVEDGRRYLYLSMDIGAT